MGKFHISPVGGRHLFLSKLLLGCFLSLALGSVSDILRMPLNSSTVIKKIVTAESHAAGDRTTDILARRSDADDSRELLKQCWNQDYDPTPTSFVNWIAGQESR